MHNTVKKHFTKTELLEAMARRRAKRLTPLPKSVTGNLGPSSVQSKAAA